MMLWLVWETFLGKTEAMNTNNIQMPHRGCDPPQTEDTTNAHAPVGYELVAFDFEDSLNATL